MLETITSMTVPEAEVLIEKLRVAIGVANRSAEDHTATIIVSQRFAPAPYANRVFAAAHARWAKDAELTHNLPAARQTEAQWYNMPAEEVSAAWMPRLRAEGETLALCWALFVMHIAAVEFEDYLDIDLVSFIDDMADAIPPACRPRQLDLSNALRYAGGTLLSAQRFGARGTFAPMVEAGKAALRRFQDGPGEGVADAFADYMRWFGHEFLAEPEKRMLPKIVSAHT